MFFIYNVSGVARPYSAGGVSRNRIVDRVSRVAAVDSVAHANAPKAVTGSLDERKQRYQKTAKNNERRVLLYAQDIMSSPVITVTAALSIYDASRIMRDARYRHLPVVAENKILVGILSDRDVLKFLAERGADPIKDMHATANDLMASEVIAAAPDAEIREIARVMFEDHIGSIPIVSQQGKVNGIVTRSDILRALIKHAPLELWG